MHGLDVVSVRVEDVRAVVGGVVVRAEPWWAVVPAPSRKGRAMEGLDLLTPGSQEGNVQRPAGRVAFDESEVFRALWAEDDFASHFEDLHPSGASAAS